MGLGDSQLEATIILLSLISASDIKQEGILLPKESLNITIT